jgi:hypothetical protein
MNRKILILLAFVTVLLLCSCSLGGNKMLISDDSDKKADARMEQILDTMKNKDKDALKAMFSKKALSEADDFEVQIEYLFGFFQGSLKSWERTGFSSDGSIEHGKKSTMLRSWYTVTTNKDKYRFFVIDYSVDTINPDNAGLYTLRVIKAADEATQFTYWEDMEIAGIYKPKE